MTALPEYKRLEATALWRPAEGAKRMEVIVSVGEATLQLFDAQGSAVGHWSLAAVLRKNGFAHPAIFAPGDDSSEELEIEDPEMIDAIDRVKRVVDKRRPSKGFGRARLSFAILVAALAALLFWGPSALMTYARGVVPQEIRASLSDKLMSEIVRLAGLPCTRTDAPDIFARLSERLALPYGPIAVLPAGLTTTVSLPDGRVLLNRTLVEDHETPEVLAGYLLEVELRNRASDPLDRLMVRGGVVEVARLVTTGHMSDRTLRLHAKNLMTQAAGPVDFRALAERLSEADVAGRAYALAVDFSGETTAALIAEGDAAESRDILSDTDWVALQGICGE